MEFIQILTAFYHLPINLILHTHSPIDVSEFAQVGINYSLNYCFMKQIFLKNDCSENFINKCFKRFMDNIHNPKETTLTVEKKSFALVLPYFSSISL